MARQVSIARRVARRAPAARGNGRERRAVLEAILREKWRALQEGPAVWTGSPDPMDAARQAETARVAQVACERSHRMFVQVEEALRRLAIGRYGTCAGCGEPIPTMRLRALPFAVRCLECQERLEGPARVGAGERQ
jgi:RNA polymerase-binding protein DksA